MNNYNKAVIFDMDGVICHTNPYHTKAYQKFLAKRGIHPSEEDFVQHMYGKNNRYILSHFLEREIIGQEFLDLENEKEELFREIYAQEIVPIDGFLPFLENLKSSGFKTGVATSAPRSNLELIMDSLGFKSKMESILASEDVKEHKPDPEVYLKSAKNLSIAPENCIVFEDSFSGVSAALNAGMKVVGVLSSHTPEELPPCDLYIKDYTDLNVAQIENLLI
ncbi:MAG TPA: HAD family phosphatase [Cyclobacteriaceae bacterium]|nr:HAD family phosphatase [Cyclobacteriaceae bacterium]